MLTELSPDRAFNGHAIVPDSRRDTAAELHSSAEQNGHGFVHGSAHGLVRRQISPASGRALEILGHAIEYLADEAALSIYQAGILDPADPRMEAIEVLTALNREVYYACPPVKPAWQRLFRWIASSHLSRKPLLP